ncbi:MAG: DUF4416 family protein [Thermodesulfovibrionaceae bacterium]
MGKPGKPKKVLLFIGTLFNDEEYYFKAKEILESIFGEILFESAKMQWNYSNYYSDELGSPIQRRFIFFKNLISEEDLAEIKIKTNEIEDSLSLEGKRKINLDPGYLGLAKIVLATTKDYSHRIYLKKGIYAEVTLIFKNSSFQPHINTYRDYASEDYIKLFNLARTLYKELIKKEN